MTYRLPTTTRCFHRFSCKTVEKTQKQSPTSRFVNAFLKYIPTIRLALVRIGLDPMITYRKFEWTRLQPSISRLFQIVGIQPCDTVTLQCTDIRFLTHSLHTLVCRLSRFVVFSKVSKSQANHTTCIERKLFTIL